MELHGAIDKTELRALRIRQSLFERAYSAFPRRLSFPSAPRSLSKFLYKRTPQVRFRKRKMECLAQCAEEFLAPYLALLPDNLDVL